MTPALKAMVEANASRSLSDAMQQFIVASQSGLAAMGKAHIEAAIRGLNAARPQIDAILGEKP